MAENGRLSSSDLLAINNGRLRRAGGSAAAWNSLCAEARRRGLVVPAPTGPNSSYRTFEAQVFFWNHQPPLAARPGTSNHGWGNAVDVNTPAGVATVKAIGAHYGWFWGEVPSEWWHVTYRGGWTGGNPGSGTGPRSLRRGMRGNDVKTFQKRLRRLCYHPVAADGFFGSQTEQVVKRFQRNRGMVSDGVGGPKTQREVRRALHVADRYRLTTSERRLVSNYLANHGARAQAALVAHRRRLYRIAEAKGWNVHDRRIRYQTLARATRDHAEVHVR